MSKWLGRIKIPYCDNVYKFEWDREDIETQLKNCELGFQIMIHIEDRYYNPKHIELIEFIREVKSDE